MQRFRWRAALAVPVILMVAAGCSSSKSSGGSGGGDGDSGGGYKIGIMIDQTGLSAATYAPTSERGIKAAFDAINKEGGVNGEKLSYVTVDTLSTPAGALSAAQTLVQQKKVFAIIAMSSVFFGASPYLTKLGVPVIAPGIDGPEWTDKANTNLFNTFGNYGYEKVPAAWGEFMKAQGVTTCGSIGASNVPTVTDSAKQFIMSCEAAGLKGSTINSSLPYGGTDIGAVALAMKNEHVDGIMLPESPNTSYALLARLKELGVELKSSLLAIGYGSDTLGSKSTVAAAQGVGFTSQGAPVELDSPGAKKFKEVLEAAGITGAPTYAEQTAYQSTQALVVGLKAADKKNVSRAEFTTALRGVKDFDAAGLYAPAKIDFSEYDVLSQGGCLWMVKLVGDKFEPYPGIPFCGEPVPGLSTK